MPMLDTPFFRKYLLPGFVFQSIVIGGGYGTGRELVEYFLRFGPLGGLLGMILSTAIWSAVCLATFELARQTGSYDYRAFTRQLLHRWWFLFEICYLVMMLLGLAVIAAASGSIVEAVFSLPYYVGVIGIMACVGFLVFKGTAVIEKSFAVWSFVLYAIYLVFLVWGLSQFFGGNPWPSLEIKPGWALSGVKYAGYNMVTIPALLFCIRHMERRREAFGAGILVGPIGMIPAFFFFLAMVTQYPAVVDRTVPANFLLEVLGSTAFQVIFQVVLLGTLIESGTGMIHAFNERVAGVLAERRSVMPAYLRPAVAVLLLVAAASLAPLGLKNLVAEGYGSATWGVILCYVLPVLTVGVWKIWRRRGEG